MNPVFLLLAAMWLAVAASPAAAWWNAEWIQRRQLTLDASAAGVALQEELANVVVPVRLHSGNFVFLDAKEDGSDLRFIASDDKTPLKYHVEKFDSINEIAIVWVQIPRIGLGAAAQSVWLYYGNPKAASASDAKASYEPSQLAVLHFAEGPTLNQDATGYGHAVTTAAAVPSPTGFIDGAVALDGKAPLVISAAPALKLAPSSGLSFSGWVKPASGEAEGTLFAFRDSARSVVVGLSKGRLFGRVQDGATVVETPALQDALPGASWSHVTVTFADRIVVYVDGQERASIAAKLPELAGEVMIGEEFAGELDEIQLASRPRSPGWVKFAHASQAVDGRLIRYGEPEAGESESASYITILLQAVTLDGWIVICILAVMLLLSVMVMIGKALTVSRTARANALFREKFSSSEGDDVGAHAALDGSSLFRVYRVGLDELRHRFELYDRQGMARNLSPQALGAIKASIDAGLVRENERLNSQMVLLTIAISGGPFLGLLGTVVGVMITFAAIAAVGDVNVNSIAPGIAAALVATVAGLGVAIPALFGYNYLASRIRGISNDTAVFADELITRFAEKYAP